MWRRQVTLKTALPVLLITGVLGLSGCGITYPSGRTDPIHDAVHRGNLAHVEKLLDRGTNVNATDGADRTPLWWAVMCDQPAIATVLIRRGGDINRGSSWKAYATPLHLAASKGFPDMIALLLDSGAAVNGGSRRDRITPLHWAAWYLHPDSVSLLLERGADVNARDVRESTPLHVEYPIPKSRPAADYASVVDLLVTHGADVNARNKFGDTPLKGAIWSGNPAAIERVRAAGANE
jgi:uncharacterized protein